MMNSLMKLQKYGNSFDNKLQQFTEHDCFHSNWARVI